MMPVWAARRRKSSARIAEDYRRIPFAEILRVLIELRDSVRGRQVRVTDELAEPRPMAHRRHALLPDRPFHHKPSIAPGPSIGRLMSRRGRPATTSRRRGVLPPPATLGIDKRR